MLKVNPVLIVSASILLVSSCSTKSVPQECPIPPVYLNQGIESELPKLEGGTIADILENRVASVETYAICKTRYDALRDFVYETLPE